MKKAEPHGSGYHLPVVDFVLDALEQGAITRQFAFDLCMRLHRHGVLKLARVRERDRALWSAMRKETTKWYGDYDFTAQEDHSVAHMLLNAMQDGVFTEQFMGELRRGLRKLAGTNRHAKNILHSFAIPGNWRPAHRSNPVRANGKARIRAVPGVPNRG